MHGCGKYVWADGKSYEGQYFDDKKHGFGIYSWPDGRVYKGFWYEGKQHGLAEYKTKTQTTNGEVVKVFYGQWKAGKRTKWFTVDQNDA